MVISALNSSNKYAKMKKMMTVSIKNRENKLIYFANKSTSSFRSLNMVYLYRHSIIFPFYENNIFVMKKRQPVTVALRN